MAQASLSGGDKGKHRMNKFTFLLAVAALGLAGCVMAPAPYAYQQPGYAPAPMSDHFVPPPEFIEGGAPVYYDAEPGVAFYPIFLDAPGSCFCVVPMRYFNGMWLGVGGAVLYRGHFPFHHAPPDRREYWNRSGGVVNGHAPVHGRIEHEGGAMRPVPPAESMHARPPVPVVPQQARPPEHERTREHGREGERKCSKEDHDEHKC